VSGGTGLSEVPDLVIGIDNVARGLLGWMEQQEGWDVRAAVIGRQIKARASDIGEKKSATGWGVTVRGRIPVSVLDERDQFFWQLNYGEGIGRYINDLGTLGSQDAIFAPNGDLKPLPVFAGYASYQHWWSSKWRSNTTFSWVDVDTYDFQELPAYVDQFGAPYERTLRASINLLYNPVPRVEAGAELLWGERRTANDTKGDASQLQLSIRYLY
jgi:hypothetical protein